MFGPLRNRRTDPSAPGPYEQPPVAEDAATEDAGFAQSFDIENLDINMLPPGWSLDDEGSFSLTDDIQDFWEVKAGRLIRHHLQPRRALFRIKDYADIRVDASLLDPLHTTVVKRADGRFEVVNDDGNNATFLNTEWTGCTVFQISGKSRREMGMFANLHVKKMGKDLKHKKVASSVVNTRTLSAADRAKFQEAKVKESTSFFENQVWEFDTTANAQPERTLTARILTKWARGADGQPKAKARLIVRGYLDIDALQTGLETSSPTTSRTSRNFLLSLTALFGWNLWCADVATAFLQGLPQQRKLWIQLPAEARQLLGASEDVKMLLLKPVYGQLDAPRRWFLEAVRRLRRLGLRQHQLDPCMFLAYEEDFSQNAPTTDGILGPSRLCGCICLHVDDMLGSGNVNSATWQNLLQELKKNFNFKEWTEADKDKPLTYCGCTLEKLSDGGVKLHQDAYLKKVHPMTFGRGLGPDAELTNKEITALRGLCGALQWPAV